MLPSLPRAKPPPTRVTWTFLALAGLRLVNAQWTRQPMACRLRDLKLPNLLARVIEHVACEVRSKPQHG